MADNFGGFYVMAPPDMFDMQQREIVDGVFIVEDDPIVFAKVNGGFLFVTAWGDDAIEPMKEIENLLEQDYSWLPETHQIEILFLGGNSDIIWTIPTVTTDIGGSTWTTDVITADLTWTDLTTDEITGSYLVE